MNESRDVYWVPYTTNAPWSGNELQNHVGACVVADSPEKAVAALYAHYARVMPEIQITKIGNVRLHGTIHIIQED